MSDSRFSYSENGLHLVLEKLEDGALAFLHMGAVPFEEGTVGADVNRKRAFRLVQAHCTGENQDDHHGEKRTGGSLSNRLKFGEIRETRNSHGLKLEIVQKDEAGVQVVSHLQFYSGLPVVRSWTEIRNQSSQAIGLEYLSSFVLTGILKEGLQSWEQKGRYHVAHSTWVCESQWRQYSLSELATDFLTVNRILLSSTGTWPTSSYLSMGGVENRETGDMLLWEIEHNGSWSAEISTGPGLPYLLLSGPSENEHQWWKNLEPGESFCTVPASVACVRGTFDQAAAALTDYRRRTRLETEDNKNCPVIFNDYMNCLWGDPTTEKLIPLIDSAAAAGCEYFVIDAGWYSDGAWWDGVGEWLPSERRFPKGIREPLDHIRKKGMIPGLWLEIEVMGIRCPLASQWPDECFFLRHGKRVIDHSRYQLDFRHPRVVAHADAVIRRLVEEYGVGYIKMDYNINAGPGTEVDSDSFGDGLLQHNRAYLAWLDRVFARYPNLVIENCGSGGMRMNHALLSRHSIQSSSDQTNYRHYAAILAGSLAAVTPEQCAVWSYPLGNGTEEETIFNMVNAMMARIHQSGHLPQLSAERLALVQEGIACYKTYRAGLARSMVLWPMGIPTVKSEWAVLGLSMDGDVLLAVWRVSAGQDTIEIPLEKFAGGVKAVDCIYPKDRPVPFRLHGDKLVVQMPAPYTARLFRCRGR